MNVLIVEDWEEWRNKFTNGLLEILTDVELEIDTAKDKGIAISKISKNKYDIVILDHYLIYENSFDLAQTIDNKSTFIAVFSVGGNKIFNRYYRDYKVHICYLKREHKTIEDLKDLLRRFYEWQSIEVNSDIERIAFMYMNPKNEEIGIEDEIIELKDELYHSNIEILFYPQVTIREFPRLLRMNHDILHFSGHLDFEGIMLRGNTNDELNTHTKEEIKYFIQAYRNNSPKCFIFNGCKSALMASHISSLGCFSIGYEDNINGAHGIYFALHFYHFYADSRDVKKAFTSAKLLFSNKFKKTSIEPLLFFDEKKIA